MKQKFISIFILILLSACSSTAPASTATALPASTDTPLPTNPPTSAPTQTAIPTENPTASYQKMEAEYIATLSPEQKALYEEYGSKDRTSEGLVRQFLTHPDLQTHLAYVDVRPDSTDLNEVVAVWNREQQKSNPALLIENNLFINENSASEIIWNPDMNRAEAKQKMADYMKYLRLKLVAGANGIELSKTLEGALANENANKLLVDGSVVELRGGSETYKSVNISYNVPYQSITINSETALVFNTVKDLDQNMVLRVSKATDGGSTRIIGMGLEGVNQPITINFYQSGTDYLTQFGKAVDNYRLAYRLASTFSSIISRAQNGQLQGMVDNVTTEIIFNDAGEIQDGPTPPIIYSNNR